MRLKDAIVVEVEDNHLTRVVIPNWWREQHSGEELAEALSEAIREALPPVEDMTTADEFNARPDMTLKELEDYMELHRKWRSHLERIKERLDAGELYVDGPSEIVDTYERLSITFRVSRFEAIHFNPEFIENASLQAIQDAIFETTNGVTLVRDTAFREERARLNSLEAELRRIAS